MIAVLAGEILVIISTGVTLLAYEFTFFVYDLLLRMEGAANLITWILAALPCLILLCTDM